jgi:hypothetical protein
MKIERLQLIENCLEERLAKVLKLPCYNHGHPDSIKEQMLVVNTLNEIKKAIRNTTKPDLG